MTPPRDNCLSYKTPHRPLDGRDGVILFLSFGPLFAIVLILLLFAGLRKK